VRLIIDTDAGVDDAQAIMLALAQPGAKIEAITTVTGNVHIEKVIANVFTVLEVMRAPNIPVFRGADQPLIPGYWQPEVRVHGEDGLGNYTQRPPTARRVEPEAAALALVRLANEAPGALTLLTLGPLTNIALACKIDPDFPRKIGRLVFMGGAYTAMGNTKNLTAEFNIFCDPEAALITLEAFPQATMISWEATMRHPLAWTDFDALTSVSTSPARFMHAITLQTTTFLRSFEQVPGYLLPDPLAMAVALDPALVQQSETHYVTVELQGTHTRGQTVVDYFGQTGRAPNVTIVTQINMDRVSQMFWQTVRSLA
jgi:purine nucleosidase